MKQIVKKILTTLLTLVIVSFLLFLAFELIPGDPARAKLGTDATPEQLAALRAQMGLDRPLMERYVTWLFAFFTGDFGTSYSYSMPVREMILDKLPITVTLTVMAFFLMIVISVPLAVFMAKHEGGIADSVFSGLNQVIMAVPSFFSGILLTLVFGVVLKLFVPGDFVSYDVNAGKFFAYLLFPFYRMKKRQVPACLQSLGALFGVPKVIRTPDLPLRRRSLYPAELWEHGKPAWF